MQKVVAALAGATGALLAALIVQQVFVEGSFGPAAMVGAGLLGIVFLAFVATFLLSRTRYRTLVANLWLAALSVVVSYAVLDLAAGWILIQPLSPPLVPDQMRHHKLVPDSYAEFHQRDFSYVQRVNAFGLRGKEISTEKAPGSYRIVMLGDSFTMGKGVEDDQTFSVVLEKLLNQSPATCGRKVEVLNAGVDSYAPVLEQIYLKNELRPLKPDMVVLNLDVSDLVQEWAYRHQGVSGPDGEIVAVPQLGDSDTLMDRVRSWTERHLFLTRVALFYAIKTFDYKEVTLRDVITRADAEIVAHTLVGDVDRTAQWNAIFDSIAKINKYSRDNGIKFLLTVYPWAHQISQTEWVPGRFGFMPKDAVASDKSNRTIHELAEANGIPLLDVTPDFRAYQGGGHLYFDYDMHWTPNGHQVMAKSLENYLEPGFKDAWCK